MHDTHVSIISYRKLSFARRYGFTVRDLMILRALEDSAKVLEIKWYERPDLPHELLSRMILRHPGVADKTSAVIGADRSPLGALTHGRTWVANSFKQHESLLLSDVSESHTKRILLDFNPFYIPPIDVVKRSFYWYDLIDNFAKHNRFSVSEKQKVASKYAFVKQHANLVTGVTANAVDQFRGTCLPNRLLRDAPWPTNGEPEFDVGFLGFITDKFDIEFVRALGARGLKILVCGHAYNKSVAAQLKTIPNLKYVGAFSAADAPLLLSRFKVGIIPYLNDKRHDESPIKFFQYVAHGRPALLSGRFNDIENRFGENVFYYDKYKPDNAVAFVKKFHKNFAEKSVSLSLYARQQKDLFWDSAIDDLIGSIST